MSKKPRDIKYASDPLEEKIEEVFLKYERAQPRRRLSLWPGSRAEIVSSVPIAPPVGYVKQPSLAERIRAMVRSEHLRAAAEAGGFETFEESEDFEVGDDYDPRSPYEERFDPSLQRDLGAPADAPPPKDAVKPPQKPTQAKTGGAGGTPPAEGAEGAETPS